MTEAETRLWARLRDRRLEGLIFRRQHPIPPYIADFVCVDAHLVVEVDGGQHADSIRDRARDQYFVERGWRLLRFWNNDVLANTEGILLQILATLGPHPIPPPLRGRGDSKSASSTKPRTAS